MADDLNKTESFKAGFLDGLQKIIHASNEFGYIESESGSVPPHHQGSYFDGRDIATDILNVVSRWRN